MSSTQPSCEPGSIFLCHSHADKHFVEILAEDLQQFGVKVWIDQAELKIGDSLLQKIEEGIETCEYLGAVLSPESVVSSWVQKELEMAMNQEIHGRRVKVLPLLYKHCQLPHYLRGKLYADFTTDENYMDALESVLDVLGKKPVRRVSSITWPEHLFQRKYYDALRELDTLFCGEYLLKKLDDANMNSQRAAEMAEITPKTFRIKWHAAGLPRLTEKEAIHELLRERRNRKRGT